MSRTAISRIWRASGSVIAQHCQRHRHQKFLRFLKLTGGAVAYSMELHLICDNYANRKTLEMHESLLRQPAFHLHFTWPACPGSTWRNSRSPSLPTETDEDSGGHYGK